MSVISPTSAISSNIINTTAVTIIRPMALAKALPVVLVLSSIVVLCICGNILVILSVFTFRPLRTVQNFFIVSLAFSDMLVAIMVMPFHIVTHVLDRWIFGSIFCQIFVTSDVLLCTSSILNLCAIALDRYWAISDPIHYARQRTIRRVLFMIILVWLLSATISIPPIIATALGSSKLRNFNELRCELSTNEYYVIYSACGSFYIPALIMTVVYAQVFFETKKRFRERAKAAAKLASVTRTRKSIIADDGSHRHHRRYKRSIGSSIMQPLSSSIKCSPSAVSGLENYSTDDGEDALYTKVDYGNRSSLVNSTHNITTTNTQSLRFKQYDRSASQVSLTISFDGIKLPTLTCDTLTTNIDSSLTSYRLNSISDRKSEHDLLHQQHHHASVQTGDLIIESKWSELKNSKDSDRKMLFKGKTLASLMHERQKISLTRERRLSRTLGIIISVFLLCWLPFFVVYILSAFVDMTKYVKEPLPTMILWLGYVNSAVNPLIYTVFNVEFRTAFKHLLIPKRRNRFSYRYQSRSQNGK